MRQRPLLALLSLVALSTGCRARPFHENSNPTTSPDGPVLRNPFKRSATAGDRTVDCQVIIAGGTTAALAAALAAAKEFDSAGEGTVCLLEPTNWPGGQLSASGVPAVDFDHHTKDKFGERFNIGTLVANQSFVFATWMKTMGSGGDTDVFTMNSNPGRCWVSVRCFEPENLVYKIFETMRPYVEKGRLKVFLSTVVKSTKTSGRKITGLKGIIRTPKDPLEKGTWDERTWETGQWQPDAAADLTKPKLLRKYKFGVYPHRLSSVLDKWYSETEDNLYTKEVVNFQATGKNPIVIDATEWGELLALSNASYDIGIEGNERCGQAIISPLALQLTSTPWTPTQDFLDALKDVTPEMKALYSHRGGGGSWDTNWRYRRMTAMSPSPSVWWAPPHEGDTSQINVNEGNDYTLEYLFPTKSETKDMVSKGQWTGGVKINVLKNAETHSLGYAQYMRDTFEEGKQAALARAAGESWQEEYEKSYAMLDASKVALANTFGTTHGLPKVPYMRDTRRSVGVRGFRIQYEKDLVPGVKPRWSVGIGVYAADQHPIQGCPAVVPSTAYPQPYYIPFEALTNETFDNLLVGGKTIAQDYLASTSTRLHPIEFATGTASGVTAAKLYFKAKTPTQALSDVPFMRELTTLIGANHGPTEWTR